MFKLYSSIPFTFNKPLFWLLSGGFIVTIVIGVFSINTCLYVTAKSVGDSTQIKYDGVHYFLLENDYNSCDTIAKYITQIKAGQDFPGEEKLNKFSKKVIYNNALINLSFLLETMLTGSVAFILLVFYRNSLEMQGELKTRYWILIFLALFWLFESFIFVVWLLDYILKGNFVQSIPWRYVAYLFHIPQWLLVTLAGLIGFVVLATIIFRFIPFKQRFTFIISGIIGGGLSIFLCFLWLYVIGPCLIR